MNLYHFNMLDVEEQLAIALSDGDYVDVRNEGEVKVMLYQVDTFYVEVYYHPKSNEIMKHRSFSSSTQLEPYLDAIDLQHLI